MILSVLMLFFLPVLQTERHHKAEEARLQREMAAALEQQQQLQIEIEHMKNDPAYVEHIGP